MAGSGRDFDLVIRGGLIVDGTGQPGVPGDVAVIGDRIVGVGEVEGRGRDEIDATDLVVAPGFIDSHTHMDCQVFWDDMGKPTCWHGVTSVVMGNCGFTLAPAHADARALVVRNLERAEDIPSEAIAAGIDWTWQTFAEYLDAVDVTPKGVNYAASIGHSALRTWAMGERAFDEDATAEDMAVMVAELRSALRAGAVGFTTSRGSHVTPDGRPVASRRAPWDEVVTLVDIMGHESEGVFQLSPDRSTADLPARLRTLAISSTAPIVFGAFATSRVGPPISVVDETVAAGGEIYALTHCRGVVAAQSFLTRLGFDSLKEWQDVRRRPLHEQKAMLADPEVRERLVHAAHHGDYGTTAMAEAGRPDFEHTRVLQSPYPPNPTVAEEARRRQVDPVEAMIDIALEHDLDVFFLSDLVHQEDEDVLRLMRHPRTAMGFSDSGAHVSQVFDSSIYTHLLGYWVRQRQEFSLHEAVQMITSRPADIWRLSDRGRIIVGNAADLTIFDPATVGPLIPEVVVDLPGGARRLEQRAAGIVTTIVNGQTFTRDGEATDARPGRLLRAIAR